MSITTSANPSTEEALSRRGSWAVIIVFNIVSWFFIVGAGAIVGAALDAWLVL